MNYIRIYKSIIENARTTLREGYVEVHHIVPKCMGGTNDKENLVMLSCREHYLCHWLLCKIHKTKELYSAFAMMCVKSSKHKRELNSRHYERARIARHVSTLGENNPMFGKISAFKGKKHTPEVIEKIRLSKLGKKRSPFKRSPATQETKDKISASKKGVPRMRA